MEPTGDATPEPAESNVPSFDVVRVEPTGETVVAGLASPMAKVEVLDGAEPVAAAEANERGEWAMVLEVPLQPGTHDLAVRMSAADGSEAGGADSEESSLRSAASSTGGRGWVSASLRSSASGGVRSGSLTRPP